MGNVFGTTSSGREQLLTGMVLDSEAYVGTPPARKRLSGIVIVRSTAKWVYLTILAAFSIAPLVVVLASSFTRGYLMSFPPHGLSTRWYSSMLQHPTVFSSFWHSALLACATAIATTAFGLFAGYLIVRSRNRWIAASEAVFTLPLVLPSIVFGLGAAQFLNLSGIISTPLQLFFAYFIISLPFSLRSLIAVLRGIDRSVEEAALSLGASRWTIVVRIVVPLVARGALAGGLFAFVMAFDNVTVSLWFTGPGFNVFPMWLFSYVQQSANALPAAVASTSMVIGVLAVILLDRLVGLERYMDVSA